MTSFTDRHGLSITNAKQDTASAYDAYVLEFLSYGARLRDLFEAADAAPGCALVNAHAAALHLAFEGLEGWRAAAPYLERMKRAAGGVTARERLFCEATAAWSRRDYETAFATLDALTRDYPEDIAAAKWAQYHAFNLGDQAGMAVIAERMSAAHRGEPYAHGMIAFALEQNHRLEEAEAEGLKAVEIAIDDAWAHHAVAHVMETQGRAEDGVKWLDHCAHTWDRKGVFIRDHNWWHAALFRLALDRRQDALDIYDARLWGAWPEFPQEQIGAVSMLWRLEMRGVDIGDRWTPVVDQARRRTGEHVLPFHDLHYLFALARAGAPGEGEAFLKRMERHAAALTGPSAAVWRDACLPCARAIFAFAEDDYSAAAQHFSAARDLRRIGGSHAQRHIFVEARQVAEKRLAAPSRVAH